LGVLAVGFATAFDGLVGGYFAQDQGGAELAMSLSLFILGILILSALRAPTAHDPWNDAVLRPPSSPSGQDRPIGLAAKLLTRDEAQRIGSL
jgi:hypothetical protein